MAMTIGTLAMKLFESAAPLPLTRADLTALSPQTDFNTNVPTAEWKNIVVFTFTDADATGVAHFILDTRDGRPVVRTTDLWRQQSATPATKPEFACIAIGLKGDFSRKSPTEAQMDELANLTCILQRISHIPHRNVRLHNPGNAFPVETFTGKLLK